MDTFLRQRCAVDRADGCNYWDQEKMKLRICVPNSSPIFTMSLCRSDHCDIYPLSLRDFSPFSSPVYFPSANQKSSFSKYFIPFPPSFFKLNICFCSRSFPSFPLTKYQKCKGIKQYMSGSLLPYFVKFELFELALLGLLPQWDTRVMWANWKIQESSQKPSPAESNNTLGERLVKIVSGKTESYTSQL